MKTVCRVNQKQESQPKQNLFLYVILASICVDDLVEGDPANNFFTN